MQLAGVSALTSCNAHTVLSAGQKLWQHEGIQGLYRGGDFLGCLKPIGGAQILNHKNFAIPGI